MFCRFANRNTGDSPMSTLGKLIEDMVHQLPGISETALAGTVLGPACSLNQLEQVSDTHSQAIEQLRTMDVISAEGLLQITMKPVFASTGLLREQGTPGAGEIP